jgi:DNA mismatch repair protein MutS
MNSIELPKKELDTLSEYYFYHNQIKKLYGDSGLVLYHNGSFYEIYAKTRDELFIYSQILRFHIANKKFSNNISGFMIGIQFDSALKYIELLLQHNLTILIISQVSDSLQNSSKKARKPTVIYSPGAPPIECETNESESNTTVIAYYDNKGIGIAAIDLLTGELEITNGTEGDGTDITDFWYTFTNKFSNIKQTIVYTNEPPLFESTELHTFTQPKTTLESILTQVYPSVSSFNDIPTELGIDNKYLESVVLCTFTFIQDHNPIYLRHIQLPHKTNDQRHLFLPKNTLSQLNVTGNNKQTIFDLFSTELNTALGRRKLKYTLTHPMVNKHQIQSKYHFTELVKTLPTSTIKKDLKGIYDIVKLFRKLGLGELSVSEFYKIYDSLYNIKAVVKHFDTVLSRQFGICDFDYGLEHVWNYITSTVTVDKFEGERIIFIESQFPEYDTARNKVSQLYTQFEEYIQTISKCIDTTKKCIQITFNSKLGYTVGCTRIRGTVLEKNKSKWSDTLDLKYTNNTCSITSQKIKDYSHNLTQAQEHFDNIYIKVLDQFKRTLYSKLENIQYNIFTFIELLDISICNYNISTKYKYSQPTLVDSNISSVVYSGLRHPLAERIVDTKWVTHDLSLNHEKTGILLYGINAAGKSMLLRSVGLAVIMAQSGLYVPCDSMELSVYHHIVSQVDMVDDFYKSSSSFMVEIQGIKNILSVANERTLVLADELCKGTESTSGAAILGSLLTTLLEKKVSFLLTTHLHELTKVDFVSKQPKLRVCHLSIEKHDDNIIFNRELNEGPSETLYGIKVAEYMNLGLPFISTAKEICDILLYNKSTNIILDPKKSKYNTKKKVLACEICTHKPKKNEIPLDTHHINFQCTANSEGFIDHYHKNEPGNLVILCKECHQNVHSGNLIIDGYKKTGRGTKLIFSYTNLTQI